MTTHLTDEQMLNYSIRRVSFDEIGKLTEHLHACRSCYQAYLTILQRKFPIEIDFEELGGLKGWHLQGQELMDYVEARMSELDFDYASLHLQECADCEQRVNDALTDWFEYESPSNRKTARILRPFWQDHVSAPFRTSSLSVRIAAAILVAVGFVFVLWTSLGPKSPEQSSAKTPSETTPSEPSLRRDATASSNSDREVGLPTENKNNVLGVAGIHQDPPQAIEHRPRWSENDLIARELVMPASIEELDRTPKIAIRGGHPSVESFAVIEPYATLLRTPQPTFSWTPLPGARLYRVSVYDADLHVVGTSGPLTDNQWTITGPLKPGKVYTWAVTAIKEGLEVSAPAAPGRAEFKILSKGELANLERRTAGVVSQAARARLYAEAGLLVDAEVQFLRYLSKNPDDERVRNLLRTIRGWRGIER
jgi:hypothetical protein